MEKRRGAFQIHFFIKTKMSDLVGYFLRKRKTNQKHRSIIHPIDFIECCKHKGKAKRDQESMQSQKNVGGLSMETPSLKIGRWFFEKKFLNKVIKCSKASQKNQIKNPFPIPIHFFSTAFTKQQKKLTKRRKGRQFLSRH